MARKITQLEQQWVETETYNYPDEIMVWIKSLYYDNERHNYLFKYRGDTLTVRELVDTIAEEETMNDFAKYFIRGEIGITFDSLEEIRDFYTEAFPEIKKNTKVRIYQYEEAKQIGAMILNPDLILQVTPSMFLSAVKNKKKVRKYSEIRDKLVYWE